MAEVVKMPKLSDTMTEGVVSKWIKKVGDKVKSGDILAEIDSDKATMEFESFYDGTLLYIGVPDKKAAPVDSILAIIGKEGEDIQAIIASASAPAASTPAASTPAASTPAASSPAAAPSVATPPAAPSVASAPVAAKPAVSGAAPQTRILPASSGDSRVKASPLAKRLAKEKGIPVNRLQGTGEGGRVVKRDIENFSLGTQPQFVGKESFEDVSISQMRKTIARRLAESKFSAPHFYLTMEIRMDEAIKARASINTAYNLKLSFNDLVIKAAASALRQHPKVNASWLGEVIRYNHHIHIGVAVAVEDGLLVPVIRFADSQTLSNINEQVKTLAQKAKEKKLQPADWEGNTFTISNLGMFGIEEFTAIINPPDACILAIGGIKETAVVNNGKIEIGNIMKVTLSCDHRVVDGATGSAFLQTFKHLLENPVVLLGANAI